MSEKAITILYIDDEEHNLHSFKASFRKQYDITMQQFNILRILRGQHPKAASINTLKERMLDKMSDVSRLVERLRKADLVEEKAARQTAAQ